MPIIIPAYLSGLKGEDPAEAMFDLLDQIGAAGDKNHDWTIHVSPSPK